MAQLPKEIEARFDDFSAQWKVEHEKVIAELAAYRTGYLQSYSRIVSLNAWRESLLSTQISADALAFFLEAQNDALVSHVFAGMGSWRSALKSLRSCIENVGFCLFYKDHPVELELWHHGQHRLEFSALFDYLSRHPQVASINRQCSGLDVLRKEYGVLSRAVHGSATFRMTAGQQSTALWESSKANLSRWAIRESATLAGLNLLLLVMFRDHLQGARLPSLRDVISLAVPASKYALVKQQLGVSLSPH